MMEQLSIYDCFDIGLTPLKITKTVRLIELFAGIGAQAKALENLGIPFEHYRVCEIDKYAVQSYNAVHGTDFEPTDITKIHADDLGIVDTEHFTYLLTYSFPCQDLSNAGFQRGMKKGSGTRSGLLWEVERLLNECNDLPQILLMENVPAVVSYKAKTDFDSWRQFLEKKGYRSEYAILNATDFGIPQHRERCYMVSWLGNHYYKFPQGFNLEKTMKDFLEEDVDEKYYINSKKAKELIDKLIVGGKILTDRQTDRQTDRRLTYASTRQKQSMSQTPSSQGMTQESVLTRTKRPECVKSVGWIEMGEGSTKHQSNTVYDPNYSSPCLYAGEWKEPLKVVECRKLD